MGWNGIATPITEVTSSPFHIGKYEVTYALWYEVKTWASSNGYTFANEGREGHDGTIGAAPTAGNTEPATTMTWRDAVVWCNAYSEMQGLEPVYKSAGAVVLSNATDGVTVDAASFEQTSNGYRLPTEAEWEYASRYRDGLTYTPGDYPSGVETDTIDTGNLAWYGGNSAGSTHRVGVKKPNDLRLSDMSGNVHELVWGIGAYPGGSVTNPSGPAIGNNPVVRGGSFRDFDVDRLRCADRLEWSTNNPDDFIGFRFARGL